MMAVFLLLLTVCCVVSGFTRGFPRVTATQRLQNLGYAPKSTFAALPGHQRHSPRLVLFSQSLDGLGDSDSGENLKHLEQEFAQLLSGKGGGKLSYERFKAWEEVQALLTDGLCTVEEIEELWVSGGGVKTLKDKVDFEGFVEINRRLDDLFEYVDEREDEENMSVEGEDDMADDIEDVYSPTFDPVDMLEPEFVGYLKQFFDGHARKSPPFGLTFDVFAEWEDIKRMLSEGQVDSVVLKELWAEAIVETTKHSPDKIKQTGKNIDFDTFLRLNMRLDQAMDELQEALEGLSEEQVEQYYREEFAELTKGGGADALLGYEALMGWADMREMLSTGMLMEDQVAAMWDALPKQPLPFKGGSKKKGFGNNSAIGADKLSTGINLDAFLALNQAFEDASESEVVGVGVGGGNGDDVLQ